MTCEPRFIGPCVYPAGHPGRFPLPLRVALAILSPSARDAGDYTDNARPQFQLRWCFLRLPAYGMPSCAFFPFEVNNCWW